MKQQPPSPGGPIGQYYLLDKIAQGGMAEIYKGLAYDLHGIKRTVVIKKILPTIAADQEFINMLISEAKTAVMLNHGNIAQVYDLGKVGDDYFMVMEFVDGKSLSQIHKRCVIKGDLIPVEYVCYFIAEVANGLNYMHRKTDEQGRLLNIIHRDISPQNIIVSYSGTVKIIDFGIAKAAIKMDITESGVLKGKFAYMSPEQARGDRVDHRSDTFSLGVILYELLTGRRLFKAENARETLKNVRRCQVPPPSSLRADLPPDIDRIVLKALAADRDKRYFFASEFHNELVKFMYGNYPNFSPAKLSEFITNIFADEIEEAKELDEDAKTPLLIIDRTQSAIADPSKLEETGLIKAPPHTEPFFPVEETALKKFEPETQAVEEVSEHTAEAPADKLPKQDNIFKRTLTALKKNPQLAKKIRNVSFLVGGVAILILMIIGMWRTNLIPLKSILTNAIKKTPTASLKITSDPADVKILIDGKKVSDESPAVIGNITASADHTLNVSKKGYVPYTAAINLVPGEEKELEIKLEQATPLSGTVILESAPPGATVYLNDVETKFTTPVSIGNLEHESIHKVGLFLKNHKFWHAEFQVKGNETTRFAVPLEADVGSVEIISSPDDAIIMMNGTIVGNTPKQISDLKPGSIYTIIVSKEGYSSWKEDVKIVGGKELFLNPVLQRVIPQEDLPPPPIPEPPPPEEIKAEPPPQPTITPVSPEQKKTGAKKAKIKQTVKTPEETPAATETAPKKEKTETPSKPATTPGGMMGPAPGY